MTRHASASASASAPAPAPAPAPTTAPFVFTKGCFGLSGYAPVKHRCRLEETTGKSATKLAGSANLTMTAIKEESFFDTITRRCLRIGNYFRNINNRKDEYEHLKKRVVQLSDDPEHIENFLNEIVFIALVIKEFFYEKNEAVLTELRMEFYNDNSLADVSIMLNQLVCFLEQIYMHIAENEESGKILIQYAVLNELMAGVIPLVELIKRHSEHMVKIYCEEGSESSDKMMMRKIEILKNPNLGDTRLANVREMFKIPCMKRDNATTNGQERKSYRVLRLSSHKPAKLSKEPGSGIPMTREHVIQCMLNNRNMHALEN